MSDAYYVLQLKNLTPKAELWLNKSAFKQGALGISEQLDFRQPEGEEDVFTIVPDDRLVNVYFETEPPRDWLEEIHAQFPEIESRISAEANRDWLAEWKKNFKPFALAGDIWVVPSWCQPPEEAKRPIFVDPGMAFGTGTHETTQLVAEELYRLPVGPRLLDVGTGTGILAVMAKHLGFQEVAATEIEEDARRVARENFSANNVNVDISDMQIEDLALRGERYDIVVANIIDGVLVRVQDTLKALVQPGGWLVVSGIITEREKDFLDGFKLPDGKLWRVRRQKGDWLLYAVQL